MKSALLVAAAAAVALGAGTGARAATPDEWKQFNADVEKKCGDAAADLFRKPQVVVDPVGSENFGLAVVFGRSKEAKGRASAICIVNKKTGVVEIGTEMGSDLVRVRKAKDDEDDDGNNGDSGSNSAE